MCVPTDPFLGVVHSIQITTFPPPFPGPRQTLRLRVRKRSECSTDARMRARASTDLGCTIRWPPAMANRRKENKGAADQIPSSPQDEDSQGRPYSATCWGSSTRRRRKRGGGSGTRWRASCAEPPTAGACGPAAASRQRCLRQRCRVPRSHRRSRSRCSIRSTTSCCPPSTDRWWWGWGAKHKG